LGFKNIVDILLAMLLKDVPEDFMVREVLTPALGEGEHALFLLRKRERNTEDCVQWLSERLHIPRKHFGLCGNKDKRAITEQYVTIRGAPRELRTPNEFTMTFLGVVREPLYLGAHNGNVFTITVREVPGNAPAQLGVVRNYFGEQRFSTRNDEIGFMLLRREYAAAAQALGLPPSTDPISALRTVPKRTLTLYVHAAQSRLWNDAVAALRDDEIASGMTLALPGYGVEIAAAMRDALTQRGLDESSFVNRSFQELSVEGIERPVLQDVQDFAASNVREGTCTLRFRLPSGQYATETVRQLWK
jgi:tRNA(Glu) U13 pseudouridine synthase TruD